MALPMRLPAGSAIFFHAHIVHGSMSNRTQTNRRAIVLTYQPAGHRMWKVDEIRPIAAA